jgi:energy-converting hydrogenase Eha subunit H
MNHCGSLIMTFILILNLSKYEKHYEANHVKISIKYKRIKSKKDPKVPFSEEGKAFNKSISS